MSDSKRPRMGHHSAGLPEPGTDASDFIADRALILRHGTSLQLMALVSESLNRSEEFADIDPQEDWEKWSSRRPGFSLYYAALIDPARDGADSVVAALRAVLDGVPEPTPPHQPRRLIIDYVTTAPAMRGRGLASLLVSFVLETARCVGANMYVLALEDSCVYWMGQGFVLEEAKNLNARLNIFPDTHLLRRSGDAADMGSPDDLALAVEEGEEDEAAGEEGAAPGGPAGDGGGGGEEEDDDDVQLALALSLSSTPQPAAPAPAAACARAAQPQAGEGGDDDDDAELRAAIVLSLGTPGAGAK